MKGEILLPITAQDNVSNKLEQMAKSAEKARKKLIALTNGSGGGGTNNQIDKTAKMMENLQKASEKVGDAIKRNFREATASLYNMENEAISLRGRLILALDPGTSVNEALTNIEQQALDARVPVDVLATAFANLGATSGQYFSNEELASFVGSLSGYATIVGATTTQIESAQYQLTQAFSKGRLAMDDFRPLMNSLPGIANDLAEQLGVSVQELQRMVSAGEVTTDKLKNAFIDMGDVVQERLANMPRTFEQSLVGVNNSFFRLRHNAGLFINEMKETQVVQDSIAALQLALDKLNAIFVKVGRAIVDLFGGKATQVVDETADRVNALSNIILFAFGLIATGLVILAGYWIYTGIVAFISTFSVMAPIYAVIGAILLVIAILRLLGFSFQQIFGFAGGVIAVFVAFAVNIFIGFMELVLGIVNLLGNAWAVFANVLGTLFDDPVGSIIRLMANMANTVLSIINSIAKAIDSVFGSNLSGAVTGWMNDVDNFKQKAYDLFGIDGDSGPEWEELTTKDLGLESIDYADAWNSGFELGGNIGGFLDNIDGLGNFGDGFFSDANGAGRLPTMPEQPLNGLGGLSNYDASKGTGSLSTRLDKESIDELKAFAEIQYRLEYSHVTPDVNINFGDVRETANLDDITKYLEKMMREDLEELYMFKGGR